VVADPALLVTARGYWSCLRMSLTRAKR
jgi:hypothetical protein